LTEHLFLKRFKKVCGHIGKLMAPDGRISGCDPSLGLEHRKRFSLAERRSYFDEFELVCSPK
jgi:hypothetical protein